MEFLQLKNAIFDSEKITLLRKKGNIIIAIEDIFDVAYDKPSLFNFFLMFLGGAFSVGVLEIHLRKKINKKRMYLVRIKFKEVMNLPGFYLKKIDPTNKWGWQN